MIKVALPAIVSADLRLNEPGCASLPNIKKAKALTTIADLGAVNVLVTCPESAAAEAAKFSGIAYVLHAEDAGNGLAEDVAGLIVSLSGGYSLSLPPPPLMPRTSCPGWPRCLT